LARPEKPGNLALSRDWRRTGRATKPHLQRRISRFRDFGIPMSKAALPARPWVRIAGNPARDPPPKGQAMKYLLTLYAAPAAEPAYGTPEFDAMMEEYFSLAGRMKDTATFLAGEGLKPVETATTLRKRGGKVETMDGPFAETREHLGGFYLIDAPDLDAALRYAAEIPAARYGSVEVRPVMDY
jgi:hypothetical protein